MLNKIVHVNKAFHPEIGGIETVCRTYANVSKKVFRKVSVLTLSGRKGFLWDKDQIDDLKVIRCRYQFKIYGHRFSISFMIRLFLVCFGRRMIHLHDPFPLASIVLFFKPNRNLIITYHSDIIKQIKVKKFVDFIRKKVLLRAAAITVTSKEYLEHSDLLESKTSKKYTVLPIYLDNPSIYQKTIEKDEVERGVLAEFDVNQPFLLVLGRITYYKGLDIILKALKKNITEGQKNTVPIVIIGKIADKEAQRVINLLLETGANIYHKNTFLTEKDKTYLIQKSAGLLFLSNLRSEAFGIVQLEAMAAGKPIVNLKIKTGVPWVSLDKVTGRSFEPTDYSSIANLISNQNGELENLAQFSANAIKRVDKYFSRQKNEEILISLYQKHS